MRSAIAAALSAAVLAGCAAQVIDSRPRQTYAVGQRLTASVGGTMLRVERGSVDTVKRWVGILNSPTGWKTETRYSPDFVASELIYAGKAGTTVELSYREYRGGLAAPAFFQSLKYDLASSDTVTFQNFRIRIYSADNNGIQAVLLSDGRQ